MAYEKSKDHTKMKKTQNIFKTFHLQLMLKIKTLLSIRMTY